jgi:hypothetical protein
MQGDCHQMILLSTQGTPPPFFFLQLIIFDLQKIPQLICFDLSSGQVRSTPLFSEAADQYRLRV